MSASFLSGFYRISTLGMVIFMCSCGSSKKKEPPALSEIQIQKLLEKNTCFACHKTDKRLVGPSYLDIAKRNYTNERIVELVYKPEPENWPDYPAPMVGLPHLDKNELLQIARWINSLE